MARMALILFLLATYTLTGCGEEEAENPVKPPQTNPASQPSEESPLQSAEGDKEDLGVKFEDLKGFQVRDFNILTLEVGLKGVREWLEEAEEFLTGAEVLLKEGNLKAHEVKFFKTISEEIEPVLEEFEIGLEGVLQPLEWQLEWQEEEEEEIHKDKDLKGLIESIKSSQGTLEDIQDPLESIKCLLRERGGLR